MSRDQGRNPRGRALAWTVALLTACGSSATPGADPPPTATTQPAATDQAVGSQAGGRPAPGTGWVIFGADTVTVEVARSASERQQGLMNRTEVPDGTGMLFVFPQSRIRSFWMQNTYVDLDIAYIDDSLRIIDIQQMKAETTDPHESSAPAMFALEVRMGWFAEHGIEVGTVAEVVFQ